jgi:hypothetical protein
MDRKLGFMGLGDGQENGIYKTGKRTKYWEFRRSRNKQNFYLTDNKI